MIFFSEAYSCPFEIYMNSSWQVCMVQNIQSKGLSTVSIHLPLDRVRDARVFEMGIELCGSPIIRNKTKIWVVLFTCEVYRAVHLELTTAISTESFLLALRRFIPRRGCPSVIYRDNETNFTGTSAVQKKGKLRNSCRSPNDNSDQVEVYTSHCSVVLGTTNLHH